MKVYSIEWHLFCAVKMKFAMWKIQQSIRMCNFFNSYQLV